tara:strand:- start:250 stop:654 length:405 start_codon:yes stop_codon:yes gene_type:complete
VKTFYKIVGTIIFLIVLNLVLRIIQERFELTTLYTIVYFLITLGALILGMNWITKTNLYKKEYLKSVITVFVIVFTTIIASDLLHQILYSAYIFTPRIFQNSTIFIQGLIFLIIVSLVIGLFYRTKKIKLNKEN